MAKKKTAAKALTTAHKKQFMTQLAAAAGGLKTLAASMKKLRAHAVASSYVGGAPMKAARRRKRG